ncbi:LAMI_0H12046g1_1 [Lachancea mirantina]|uniref:LAMI_0H12046g1_1 n=1 Tax=Lachancea mirantina TaxID=1230905 RepID=A0A1G4KHF6_9SACH|nr:LAMI_0H12046g1_1 [Lachancea mirantina]
MKSLRWSNRGRKASSTSEERHHEPGSRGKSLSGSTGQESKRGSGQGGHSGQSSGRKKSLSSGGRGGGWNENSTPSIYLSEANNNSSRSIASSRSSIRIFEEVQIDETRSLRRLSDSQSTVAPSSTTEQPRSQQEFSAQSKQTLNKENYDQTLFKKGWVNKAHGASNGHQRDSRLYGNAGHNAAIDAAGRGNGVDYRLYRAELRGSVLSLYKSGVNNVKCFDPSLTPCDSSADASQPVATPGNLKATSQTVDTNSDHTGAASEIKYLSHVYPHPDLKLDGEGHPIAGTTESLCHMVLFSPPSEPDNTKRIVEILLILPLIDHISNFLQKFRSYGIAFTRHRSKSVSTAPYHHQISSKTDTLMTERLALVVKTILDVFCGFLLDDKLFPNIIDLVDTISLHDDEISSALKLSIVGKQKQLTNLITLGPQERSTEQLQPFINVEKFLRMDLEDVAHQVHQINLKFMKEWSPQIDFSLLYESKFNGGHIYLNPMIFRNNENVHFLGRLFVSHLFSPEFKPSPRARAKVLAVWVQLGCKFEKLGDMVSWLAIATVVCSIPILRLASTWQFVPENVVKLIFRDWIPTIAQLDRREMSSKSTSSVFILAPPNLKDENIRKNVVPYFGDLAINAFDLSPETRLRYLEKKIHRTKNAFYKWQQRLDQAVNSTGDVLSEDSENSYDDYSSCPIYQYWKFHLEQEALDIATIMEMSLRLDPPRVDQRAYSNTSSKRSLLLTGSYLPVLFNDLISNYSLFPKQSLIGAAGLGDESSSVAFPSRAHFVSSISAFGDEGEKSSITGIENLDEPVAKRLSSKQSNKQKLLKSIRDAFNIDMNMFHVSDDMIFKSVFDLDGKSRPASIVVETPKRMSQNSSFNNFRDSQDLSKITSTLDDLDFFNSIGKSSSSINESFVEVVLKSATLERLFDVLVLTTSVFSKLIDARDLEAFFAHESRRQKMKAHEPDYMSMGPLDYAFIKLIMDNDIFTQTFFNTYTSFTTTNIVLENLAKRFIGAVSCAVSISRLLSDEERQSSGHAEGTKLGHLHGGTNKFPAWDLKNYTKDEVNLNYVAKIQLGAMEALLHLIVFHYSDFTGSLTNNYTFLDILKVMDHEISEEWSRRIVAMPVQRTQYNSDDMEELEALHAKLRDLFKKIKSAYQKQLYRPLNLNRPQKIAQDSLRDLTPVSMNDFARIKAGSGFMHSIISDFTTLNHGNFSALCDWATRADEIIAQNLALVSHQEWIQVSQILELFSNDSLVSLFKYPLFTISGEIIHNGGSRLEKLEILNVFTWVSSVCSEGKKLLLDLFPPAIQLLIKLHLSLTRFLISEICSPEKGYEERLDTTMIIFELLGILRWKGSAVDLFHDDKPEGDTTELSPHVPSFLESCLVNAIVSPESRYFEMFWRDAHQNISGAGAHSIKCLSDVINSKSLQSQMFEKCESIGVARNEPISPCPGWLICRLLEISQFVPNMSIENSKMINFDKRRFVNNVITNFVDMIPKTYSWSNEKELCDALAIRSEWLTQHEISEIPEIYDKQCREISMEQARLYKFQSFGFFNSILVAEVEKVKRDQRKYALLLTQELENKKQIAFKQGNRLSSSPSTITLSSVNSKVTTESDMSSRTKRSSITATSTRNSMISNSTHSSGVTRKLGGFLRRPFSIGGFSSSSSTNSLSSIIAGGAKGNGTVSPFDLPEISSNSLKESKPIQTLRTFEMKSCMPVNDYSQPHLTSNQFRIIMEGGTEHLVQAPSNQAMLDWVKALNLSRRYSFHSEKFKGKTSNKMFGVPIEDVCERENTLIPTILVKLLEEIELRGLDEVGLYRVPGAVGSINALKNAFDDKGATSNSFTLEDERWFEINTIAGCFKLYLRELPESLFTNERLPAFAEHALQYRQEKTSYEQFKMLIADLVQNLPVYNFHTLRRIFQHLHRVDEHMQNNRMDAINLAIVFSMSFIGQEDLASSVGPTLGALQTILKCFIKHPEDFF